MGAQSPDSRKWIWKRESATFWFPEDGFRYPGPPPSQSPPEVETKSSVLPLVLMNVPQTLHSLWTRIVMAPDLGAILQPVSPDVAYPGK